jgi:hypothetical protein
VPERVLAKGHLLRLLRGANGLPGAAV